MTEEKSGVWKIVWTILAVGLIIWSWFLYSGSGGGSDVISRLRLAEDGIWFFASIFLMYFSYRLMVLSKGGRLEKGFLAFMLSFFIIVLWKYIGVNERIFALPQGALHDFKETLEGLSGVAIGLTFLYMYNLLRPKE
jgi:hypothetical protein